MYVEIEDEEVRNTYIQDLKEKSQAGRGIFGRASRKKGFKGGVRFQSDEIINNRKLWKKMNGKVKVYYMNEIKVRDIKDLIDMNLQEEIDLITEYKNNPEIGFKKLVTIWPVDEKWLTNVMYRYNKMIELGKDPKELGPMLPQKLRNQAINNKKAEVQNKQEELKEEPKEKQETVKEKTTKVKAEAKLAIINIAEIQSGEAMLPKLEGISTVIKGIGMMMDKNKKYEISVVIREV